MYNICPLSSAQVHNINVYDQSARLKKYFCVIATCSEHKTKLTVTARSVELGSISLATLTINIINTIIISTVGVVMAKATILDIIDNGNVAQIIIVNDPHTWIEAPVISRISFIFEPPFPINEPHWEAKVF